MPEAVAFENLRQADLHIDQVYTGGSTGTAADDPLARLLPVGNQGGFRYSGSPKREDVRLVVLYTSGANPDWPDTLDEQRGVFVYYGDNRQPGKALHDTPRRGNVILREAFAAAAGSAADRVRVPPFLQFERSGTSGRNVRFRGLLVPGAPGMPRGEELVALWRSREGDRFQNYRATFSVLDVATVPRAWLTDVIGGGSAALSPAAPDAWSRWVDTGVPALLVAPPTMRYRRRAEQLPKTTSDAELLDALWRHFAARPVNFEACAAELYQLCTPGVQKLELTRPSRDGGRDALGVYGLGPSSDVVPLEFALEVKCYQPGNSVGVKEVARLISRIKHREFGVLITTSYVHEQAYQEIRADQHPIVIVAGSDLVEMLKSLGLTSTGQLRSWLAERYP